MKYSKEITKDIVNSMSLLKSKGEPVNKAAKQTVKALKKKYGKSFKWTGVRGKYYSEVKTQLDAPVILKNLNKGTVGTVSVRGMLAAMAKNSQQITITVNGSEVTAIFK